ncbi:MAG: HD domain-containing phosphohydrolase [Vulcanimicrobiaceae bacterium]
MVPRVSPHGLPSTPGVADTGLVQGVFLQARGVEMGPLAQLVTDGGLQIREVDFACRTAANALNDQQLGAIAVLPAGDPACDRLAEDPRIVAILHPPVGRGALLAALRALAAREAARENERLARETSDLLSIAQALASEHDLIALQQLIVRTARQLTCADAGSLYVVEATESGEQLRFAVAQTGPHDAGTYLGALLPLNNRSIAGHVTQSGTTVRLADAYALDAGVPYRFNRDFDEANSYRTKSVLCVPMHTPTGQTVGAIQLINRKPRFELTLTSPEHAQEVVEPFGDHDEQLLCALAAQAAVAMENARLVDSIQQLFERFVHASVKAIEVRDRATQGHSERVASLTIAQACTLNGIESGPLKDVHFTPDHLRELRYASLLHDFGKVAVPEYIFAKAKKLPDGRAATIRLRFLLAMEQCADPAERAQLRSLLGRIEAANEPAVLSAAADDAVQSARAHTFDDDGVTRPLLDTSEAEFLAIPRGSLSNDERTRMQDHVTQSFVFLREIPWHTTPWPNVADLAYGHHEHLDGTGYPRGLHGTQIPPQVRMMTISDIFDALTAGDRPYKAAISLERALDILSKEFAQRGKIDPLLLDIFISRRVYLATLQGGAFDL